MQFDPARYLDASDNDLRAAIDGPLQGIHRVSVNAQPGLLPINFAPEDVQGGRLSLEMYQARAKTIREHATFQKRISHLLAGRFTDRADSIHIEEQLYCGFPSNSNQTHMHSFHRHDWNNRIGVIKDIEDRRYRQFGCRIIAS